ncbi:DNA/RNA polymerases superfamily protein [Tanacetum coccineum]
MTSGMVCIFRWWCGGDANTQGYSVVDRKDRGYDLETTDFRSGSEVFAGRNGLLRLSILHHLCTNIGKPHLGGFCYKATGDVLLAVTQHEGEGLSPREVRSRGMLSGFFRLTTSPYRHGFMHDFVIRRPTDFRETTPGILYIDDRTVRHFDVILLAWIVGFSRANIDYYAQDCTLGTYPDFSSGVPGLLLELLQWTHLWRFFVVLQNNSDASKERVGLCFDTTGNGDRLQLQGSELMNKLSNPCSLSLRCPWFLQFNIGDTTIRRLELLKDYDTNIQYHRARLMCPTRFSPENLWDDSLSLNLFIFHDLSFDVELSVQVLVAIGEYEDKSNPQATDQEKHQSKDVATLYPDYDLSAGQIKHQRASGLLQPLEIPMLKWMRFPWISFTVMPTTQKRHDAIWVVVDRLTKSAHFLPIRKNYGISKLAEIFRQEIVRLHGTPTSIVSDRDPKFTSRFWKGLQKAWGTRLKFSTAFHPQTDGQSERTIQTLEDMLRACALEWTGCWDEYLCLVEFAYNNSWHASIKAVTFELCMVENVEHLF